MQSLRSEVKTGRGPYRRKTSQEGNQDNDTLVPFQKKVQERATWPVRYG